MKKEQKATLLFLILLIIDCIVLSSDSFVTYRFISKPLIVGALLLYTFSVNFEQKTKRILLFALLFSLLGDVFLLFSSELYFILGLASFLIAHIFYCILFLNPKQLTNKKTLLLFFILAAYAYFIISMIFNYLAALLPYVFAYIIVLLAMVICCYTAKVDFKTKRNFIWCFLGALLFTLSDSVLAINKFYPHYSFRPAIIMITYGLAQLFIVKAIIAEKNK